MATPQQQTKQPADAKNGPVKPEPTAAKPEPTAAKPETDASKSDDEKETRSRGVIPHMPHCAIWQDPATGKVTAALIHPQGGMYTVTGRGMGGTTGTLADEGYPIGPVRVDGPKWIQERIPAGVKVLGFANISGFPLPPQP